MQEINEIYKLENSEIQRSFQYEIKPKKLKRVDGFFSVNDWKSKVNNFLNTSPGRDVEIKSPDPVHQELEFDPEEFDYYKRFWEEDERQAQQLGRAQVGKPYDFEQSRTTVSRKARIRSAIKSLFRSCIGSKVTRNINFCGLTPCKLISALLLLIFIILAILIPTVFIKRSGSKDFPDDINDPSSTNLDGSALPSTAIKLPLLRSSRWITDSTGKRVKLQCTSWQSHMETMIPEGLSLQKLDHLASLFPTFGLNCVRFTYANAFTIESTLTVKDSVQRSGLSPSTTASIERINSDIWGLSLFELYIKVFKALENNGIMIILDNHISTPTWCCQPDDGNRWWGEGNFSVSDWTTGLTFMAKNFGSLPNVIGFSLRNEPSKVDDHASLQRYMRMGALAVHEASPSSLVIMSGITSATNLIYESSTPITSSLPETLQQKFLYEAHQYSFFAKVTASNLDSTCLNNQAINKANIFNVLQTTPLFISEWGEKTVNFDPSSPWFNCFYRDLLTLDIDNAIWPFASLYYKRLGGLDVREEWSLGNRDMTGPESLELISKLRVLSMIRKEVAIVHSRSTSCVQVKDDRIVLGLCEGGKSDTWRLQDSKMMYVPTNKCVSKSLGMVDCLGSEVAVVGQSREGYRMAVDQGCLSSNNVLVGEGVVSLAPCRGDDLDQWFLVANTTLRG